MNSKWNTRKYLITAVDPLHIGTGGQRLGRVDATVVREPVTNVPKIPGTSLSGALKFFLDLALRGEGKNSICASTAGSDNEKHEHAQCPVCAAFGYTGKKRSMQGILQFSDADMLAFPVNSCIGPVWITTAPRLCSLCGFGSGADSLGENFVPLSARLKELGGRNDLNFGWILLERGEFKTDADPFEHLTKKCAVPEACAERMILVSEFVFSNLVNSNMEIRTSVVIDPETGAAKTGGLFTYEAVVKGSIFVAGITENDYADIWAKVQWNEPFSSALDMLEKKAFGGIRAVGLGGMTTRGFGRLEIKPFGE